LTAADVPPRPGSGTTQLSSHVAKFLRLHARAQPANFGSRRADAPSALMSAAARRNKFRLTKVHNNYYVVTGGRRVIGGFAVHQTSLSSSDALRASISSPLAKQYLQLEGIPVPSGRQFHLEDFKEARNHFEGMSIPAVVKPASSTHGVGVTTNIDSVAEFESAWSVASLARSPEPDSDQRLMVEEYVSGLDVRAFVVGEVVVAAVARVPLFFIGDGMRKIGERIAETSAHRTAHPLLGKFDYDATAFIATSGYDADELSTIDGVYPLASKVNMRSGGVTVDVTDQLGAEVQELAVAAAWSIPGCKAAGVDLLVEDLDSTNGAVVLDVDVRAGISAHHYPWIGHRQQVADALVKKMHENSRG